jgi:SAM-dependent methyltransferase
MSQEFDRLLDDRYALRGWFESSLGRTLQAYEMNRLRELLPTLYGTVALQLGRIGRLDLLDSAIAPTRIVLDPLVDPVGAFVRGVPEELPFDARSVDVALLPHTLDFCDDPHQVLREVSRVLAPEGHAVIFGFNPVSLWGLRRQLTRAPRPMPWSANFFRLARIKDWLGLLDFQVTHGQMLFYQPPIQRERLRERMHFLDKMGDRWWPLMAAVYLVVAKKRVAGMTPMPLAWKQQRVMSAAQAAPARRVAAPRGTLVAKEQGSSKGLVLPFRRLPRPPLSTSFVPE